MPLVIMCGIPCSGKTKRANELYIYLLSISKNTVLIRDDAVASIFNKNEIFSDSQKEKDFRSSLKSAAERQLSKDTVVILDAGNYIKGYRYELYCLSKSCKTTCCVIHCDLILDDCWKYNEEQDKSLQYTREIFDALVLRFESPDSRNRWDSPLFIAHKDEELQYENIANALFLRKAPPPNQSTQCPPLASTNFLYDLDCVTQEITKAVIEAQKTGIIGDPITVPKAEQKISLHRVLPVGELMRIRRQFISYTKSHPVYDSNRIPNVFVQYINRSI